MKVLVFDQDATATTHLPARFEGYFGFDLVLAATQEDASFALQQEIFNIVLIAFNGSNEEELNFAVQLKEAFPYLVIGFLTDSSEVPDLSERKEDFQLGFIQKPLTPEKLQSALGGTPPPEVSETAVQDEVPSNPTDTEETRDLRLDATAHQLIGKLVGPFRISRKLTDDDWGTLYEAVQVAVNRTVALKILNPGFYDDHVLVHQFISFASAMGRAQNPYITTVYEAGQRNGLIFYAREHVNGPSLQEKIEAGQVFTEERILLVIISIAEALHYEKTHGVLHVPLTSDQVLVPDTSLPKLLNNVITEGDETSPGEIEEIQCLGKMIRQAMATGRFSHELDLMIRKMERVGHGGFVAWDQILVEARKLDLARHAMQVHRPLHDPHGQNKNKGSWKKLLMFVLGAATAFACWYFSLREDIGLVQDIGTMIQIPEGSFTYQKNEKRTLPVFYIDKYEVTIGEYAGFLKAWKQNPSTVRSHPDQNPGKDHTPDDWHSIQNGILKGTGYRGVHICDQTPVFNIDFFDAWAYAQWANKRLPKEEEWEKAARGPDGNMFPWGNTLDPKFANTGADFRQDRSDPVLAKIDGFALWSPVGVKKTDQSVYGVMGMAGNVSEWTDSLDTDPNPPNKQVPVIRGGCWAFNDAQLTKRERIPGVRKTPYTGFRCASDKPPGGK